MLFNLPWEHHEIGCGTDNKLECEKPGYNGGGALSELDLAANSRGWLQCSHILLGTQGCGVGSGSTKTRLRSCQSSGVSQKGRLEVPNHCMFGGGEVWEPTEVS